MKRNTVPKVSKTSLSKEKKKAWDLFSKYIRLRDAIRTTGTKDHARCITCDKLYPTFGKGCLQAGHYIPGRSNAILFEARGVHAQCYMCNVTFKGNTLKYRRKMIELYGEDVADELEAQAKIPVQFKAYHYQVLQEQYKILVKTLEEQP